MAKNKNELPTGSVEDRVEQVMEYLNACIDDQSMGTEQALDFTQNLIAELRMREEGLKQDLGR